MSAACRRACVIVLDSVGIGEMPDAPLFGDGGADTLGHIASATGALHLPHLRALGLGNIARAAPIAGLEPVLAPRGCFGKMHELSTGKDTTSGHWEMAGAVVRDAFQCFPGGFPSDILAPWCASIAVPGVLGNRAASGTQIIDELGAEHERSGLPIVYTSADSVFQIAAHESVVPLPILLSWCRKARTLLDAHRVARVIARPFVGRRGAYQRTYNRQDFSLAPPPGLLHALASAQVPVVGVGKIPDIFAGAGISDAVHTEGNDDGMRKTVELLGRVERGLIFVNLVDFDMLYGHRRDPRGYRRALEAFDAAVPDVLATLRDGDLLFISADHGNDPTFAGSDHTREYVPLLSYAPSRARGVNLGTRGSFADLGETLREALGLARPLRSGTSFLSAVL